jgi:hypothetical protein
VPNLRYKDYYISVFHLPDKSGKSSCIPCVEIRQERDQAPSARLMIDDSFGTTDDASLHGFAMGKQWVDVQSARKSRPSGPPGESEPLRFRLKSWLASLV